MLFAQNSLRWPIDGKHVYIDHRVIRNHMTPEQYSLLTLKCHKRDLQRADHFMHAIKCAFSEKGMKPSDLLDIQVEANSDTNADAKTSDKKDLLRRKYGKWLNKGWSEKELMNWLSDRGYDLTRYWDDSEIPEALRANPDIGETNDDLV